MYGVVLGSGCATRLWPTTGHRPQIVLPVGGQTTTERIFTRLEADDQNVDCHGTVEQVALADGLIGGYTRLPAGEPSR